MQYDSNRPQIITLAVFTGIDKSFRRSNLDNPILFFSTGVQKTVHFEISVNDTSIMQIFECIEDWHDDIFGFLFSIVIFFLNLVDDSSPSQKLKNHIDLSIVRKAAMYSGNIGMLDYTLESVNLLFQSIQLLEAKFLLGVDLYEHDVTIVFIFCLDYLLRASNCSSGWEFLKNFVVVSELIRKHLLDF